jgi:hypothetical protein
VVEQGQMLELRLQLLGGFALHFRRPVGRRTQELHLVLEMAALAHDNCLTLFLS